MFDYQTTRHIKSDVVVIVAVPHYHVYLFFFFLSQKNLSTFYVLEENKNKSSSNYPLLRCHRYAKIEIIERENSIVNLKIQKKIFASHLYFINAPV